MLSKNEKPGQEWFNQAIAYLKKDDHEAFQRHLKTAKEIYVFEYEVLSCIGLLTEANATVELVKKNISPEVIQKIEKTELNEGTAFKLETIIANFTFFKLSSALPTLTRINFPPDSIKELECHATRQSKCHEASFELASLLKLKDDALLVTGYVSILSDKYRFLHSRIEAEEATGCVLDYTHNAMININTYSYLMKAEKPLISIPCSEIRKGKVTWDDFAKIIIDIDRGTK